MDSRTIVTVLLSLLAGAAGGVGAHWIAGQATTSTTIADDNSSVLEALQRIEDRLEAGGRTGLQGKARPGGNAGSGGADLMEALSDESADGPLAKLLARIDQTVGESVKAKIAELSESEDGLNISIGSKGKKKKKVTFDEMVRELELSAEEENKLREVMKATEDEALKLLADEGQDIEELRRELKEKSRTPEGKAEMSGKLMTRFMTNMGGFIGLFVKHQAGVTQAVGAAKAGKIENSYRVVDSDFIDFDAFDMD